jgi:hypothetical protein
MCGSKLNKINLLHKKVIKKIDPLMGGDKVLDYLGLPSVFGDEGGFIKEPVELGANTVAAAPDAPTEVDSGVLAARDDERRRRAAAAGQSSTILSSNLGAAPTGRKTLLGV